jgi:hypothetical protein
MDKGGASIHFIHLILVGYPRYLFSLPILASSAFQNVPYSYFIIFTHLKILVAQAFAVGGLGMLMACKEKEKPEDDRD